MTDQTSEHCAADLCRQIPREGVPVAMRATEGPTALRSIGGYEGDRIAYRAGSEGGHAEPAEQISQHEQQQVRTRPDNDKPGKASAE